jgi:hypothetical protein
MLRSKYIKNKNDSGLNKSSKTPIPVKSSSAPIPVKSSAIPATTNPTEKNSIVNNIKNETNNSVLDFKKVVNDKISKSVQDTKNNFTNLVNKTKADLSNKLVPTLTNTPIQNQPINNTAPTVNQPIKVPDKTNEYGFPQPKECTSYVDKIVDDIIEGGDKGSETLNRNITENMDSDTMEKLSNLENNDLPPLKIIDASRDATTNITNAAIHFAVTTGAVGLNKVLDIVSFTILGLENLNIENKEEILQQLEEKVILLQYLANDEKSKILVKKLFGSLALIIMEGSEVAKEPLLRAFLNISKTTVKGVNSIMKSGTKFIKNAIKIIPIIGDAYIILDNVFTVGAAGSRAGVVLAKNAETLSYTADDVIKRVRSKIEPPVEDYEKSMEEINRIRNNLESIDIKSVLQNAESNMAHKIKKSGDTTSRAIYNVTPKLNTMKGGKKLKSSLKRKNHKKSKRVRFRF